MQNKKTAEKQLSLSAVFLISELPSAASDYNLKFLKSFPVDIDQHDNEFLFFTDCKIRCDIV